MGRNLTLGAATAASAFCEWAQVGIDVYILHVAILHPWFPAVCAAAEVYRNHFFHLYQQNKFFHVKESSERLVIVVKRFLKLPNLHMLIKQKSLSFPENLPLGTFGELLIVFLTKVNLLYLLYSIPHRRCLLHLIKQNCLLKTFLRTLILMIPISFTRFPF